MEMLKKQYILTPFYGYRKMTIWFGKYDFNINEKRVRRLMKLVNWQTIYREPRTTIAVKEHFRFYNDERFHQSLGYQTPREMYNKIEGAKNQNNFFDLSLCWSKVIFDFSHATGN
jgi:transposase InsO family protein